ncbi:hypothetical protein SAICODRAFT_93412 [Saitoella complicata NRRL Y-17804]|nr:uncharacterized protein SAICODRAFT_93412 [Saitoella complicata NRRL Y-17804]ODQ52517.1 hypothetical protein SAICODRAFT_93412 [Saitoella complicata NRRL Y-17804]
MSVAAKPFKTPYPVIDTDPHFKRVVGYMRPSDYAFIVGGYTAFPGAILLWERIVPGKYPPGGRDATLRLCCFLGLTGGFLAAYLRSSQRFWGTRENAQEDEKDRMEMAEKIEKGEPLYGVSTLSEYSQGVAARNSRYSAWKMASVPWFNFVNHNQHGVDVKERYGYDEAAAQAAREAKEAELA